MELSFYFLEATPWLEGKRKKHGSREGEGIVSYPGHCIPCSVASIGKNVARVSVCTGWCGKVSLMVQSKADGCASAPLFGALTDEPPSIRHFQRLWRE